MFLILFFEHTSTTFHASKTSRSDRNDNPKKEFRCFNHFPGFSKVIQLISHKCWSKIFCRFCFLFGSHKPTVDSVSNCDPSTFLELPGNIVGTNISTI